MKKNKTFLAACFKVMVDFLFKVWMVTTISILTSKNAVAHLVGVASLTWRAHSPLIKMIMMILTTTMLMVMFMVMMMMMMRLVKICLSCKETPSNCIPICFGPLPSYLENNLTTAFLPMIS